MSKKTYDFAKVLTSITDIMPCDHCPYPCKAKERSSRANCDIQWKKMLRAAVIKCSDCEEYREWRDGKICMRLGSYHGNMKPDDFCSYAVPKL